MLTPHEVVPFLTHDRSFVREHALRYLRGSGDTGPFTADHLWDAIDRLEALEALSFTQHLRETPQTELSYQRLMKALVSRPANLLEYHVQKAVGDIEFDLLSAHCDELLSDDRLPPETREHHQQRLALAALPPQMLWDRLLRHGADVADKYAGKFDMHVSARLVEAMARTSDHELVGRAMTALRDPAIIDTWTEIFLVQFLGCVRCAAAAVDLLIEKLLVDDADVLNEAAYQALARIGSVEVVEKVEAAYPGKEWGVRLFAREPLHRIKRPESEAALVRLAAGETDYALQGILAHDLFYMGSMQGLQRARELIASNPKDPEMRGLCAAALATAIMNGVELPEAAKWEPLVRRDEARARHLRREMDDGFVTETRGGTRISRWGFDQVTPDEVSSDRGIDINLLDATGDGPALIGAETYRREAPKIGRNDPCPCGSGKKYKKCCGG
jgi:hypothetical protein